MAAATAGATAIHLAIPNSTKNNNKYNKITFISFTTPINFPLYTSLRSSRSSPLLNSSSVSISSPPETNTKTVSDDSKRRKLYVFNLPWRVSAPQIQELFSQCGTVKDVEIIKGEYGNHKGYAFVTMATGEEARAAVEKFNSYELEERVITVEFAKSFRKPAPPPPPGVVAAEVRHKIFVSNLAWKARSVHLREFFSEKFKPLSAKVVFRNSTGMSGGYGFVAFATLEEAIAAIAELDGKELLGRPVQLRISERKSAELASQTEQTDSDEQCEES